MYTVTIVERNGIEGEQFSYWTKEEAEAQIHRLMLDYTRKFDHLMLDEPEIH